MFTYTVHIINIATTVTIQEEWFTGLSLAQACDALRQRTGEVVFRLDEFEYPACLEESIIAHGSSGEWQGTVMRIRKGGK